MKNHRAKKSLGQNFLKSTSALRAIVEAGEIKSGETVLEIGPGKGALTEQLLASSTQVIAVEKDRQLVELLKNKFAKEIEAGKLVLINDDILEFLPSAYSLKPSAYKVIANIPYNITGAIIKKFLTGNEQPERMVLMVQNEVAKRIVASDKKESLLSVSVKAYGNPEIILKVPARYFSPAPQVDSAVIVIKNISREFFTENKISEARFWEVAHAGFAHKRKKLSGNLKGIVSEDSQRSIGDKRAEDLSLSDWVKICRA